LANILQPGDLIVGLPDGFHVLVYLGNDQWIEADSTAGEVIHLHRLEGSAMGEYPRPVSALK